MGLAAFMPNITYVCYFVKDVERAVAFYVGALGMVEHMRLNIGNGEHEVVLGFPGSKSAGLILMWREGRQEPYPRGEGYSRFIIRVSNVDGAVAELGQRGVKIQKPPTDAGPLRYAMIEDPEGYVIELLQIRRD